MDCRMLGHAQYAEVIHEERRPACPTTTRTRLVAAPSRETAVAPWTFSQANASFRRQ
jgi:hypothetical protein